jgi:hypothetical protein
MIRKTFWRFRLCLALLVACLLPAALARAAGVVGDGTPASCTEAAFTAALLGGGTITFNCGGPKTILVLSEKNITQNTVIEGGGVITLTGGLTTRLFRVDAAGSLALSNITLDEEFIGLLPDYLPEPEARRFSELREAFDEWRKVMGEVRTTCSRPRWHLVRPSPPSIRAQYPSQP